MKRSIIFVCCLLFFYGSFSKEYKVESPNKKIEATIKLDSQIQIKVMLQNQLLFTLNNVALNVEGQDFTAGIKKVRSANARSVNEVIIPTIKEKYAEIVDAYNELLIGFRSEFSLSVRAYDNGVAYRFHTSFAEPIIVDSENFNLEFDDPDSIYFQRSKTLNSSYETPYEFQAVNDF